MKMLDEIDWCTVFSIIMIVMWAVVWFLYFASLIYGKVHLHKRLPKDIEKSRLLGVSIAKPLNGCADPNLLSNLDTYFNLDYPEYELLFCVQDESDHELIKLVNGLIIKYPNIQAQLFIGAQNIGVNPKVNNMMNAYANAKYPLFMISDSSIKMREDTLKDMVNYMTDRVGLVHQLPLVNDGHLQFSRQLEKVYFGGPHARVYVSANAFGINCMTSMSCLFRKKILDEEGGLSKISCYIGEDYFLGQLIVNKGWKIALCSQPAQQNAGFSSVPAFQERMMRWMYIRFTEMPHVLILEPLQEHIVLGPLTALAMNYLFAVPFLIFFTCHFVSWCLADYILFSVLENRRPPFSIFAYIRAWVFRELSFLYMYPKVLFTRHISWGGQKFIIHYGGLAEKVSGGCSGSRLSL